MQLSTGLNLYIHKGKPGIDQAAMEQTMAYLKAHKDDVLLDDRQLDLLQAELEKYIAQRT